MFEALSFLSLAWLMFFGGEVAHELKAAWLRNQYHYAK